MQISQMSGFVLVLLVSTLFLVGTSLFGHGDDVDLSDGLSNGDSGPDLLSLRNLSLFGLGFGSVGAIATHMGATLVMSCAAGTGSGLVFAFVGWMFYKTINRQQASSNTNTGTLVGKQATVSAHIAAGQVGQVIATDTFGSTIYLDARSQEDGRVFAEGEQVYILQAAGNLVRVAKQMN